MLDDCDRLVGLIYDGVTDEASWDLALKQLAEVLGAAGVGLGMQDMRTHAFRNLGAFGIDPEMNQTYRRLAPENRIWREIGRRRQPLTDTMVMPKAVFLRTELYADWFRPQNFYSVMAFPALFRESHSAVVVAFRNRSLGGFEAEDLAQLDRFAKHFGRALGFRLDREQSEEQLAATNLLLDEIEDAILLVDRDLLLCHANAAARAMLETGRALRSRSRRLELHDPRKHAELAQMAAGARRGELRLSEPGPKCLIVQLHACAPRFGMGTGTMTVRIIDPNGRCERPTPARLRDRLGLTQRQAEAIVELASGATEKDAAEKLGIGAPTLHTHVRCAYDRLDLRSRAELMALLARHGFETPRSAK
jgi:DNA-binding CsgD family transcriptional regulator/PAS domain-containing protein